MSTENAPDAHPIVTTPLGVLRQVWDGGTAGGGASDLDEIDSPKVCKRTEGLDFGSFGDADGVGTGGDLRTAWRSKLAREGKLVAGPDAISVRDLVIGSKESMPGPAEVAN